MPRRRRIAATLLAAVCAAGLLAGGFVLAQDRNNEDPKAWIKAAAQSHPLSDEQRERLSELFANLGDDSYSVRERATLDLLLLPQGVAQDLDKLVQESDDPEVRARAAWLLREMRGTDGPALPYLSRITGISRASLRVPLTRGGVLLDRVIDRIPADRMPEDVRIWGALVVAADTPERTERIMGLYRRNAPDQPWLSLYRALLENFAGRPESRARLVEAVSISPPDEALALAESSLEDSAPAVILARRKLAERLRKSLDAPTLLRLWRESGDRLERRRVVMASLSLNGVEEPLRSEWIEILKQHEEPELAEAILALACRDGLTDVIEARLGESGRGDRLLSLLCTAGEKEAWQRLVDPSLPADELMLAASWLPYTALLSSAEQAELLLGLAQHQDATVKELSLDLLSSYGSASVANRLLELARENPADQSLADAVASHYWQVRQQVPAPWTEPWWEAAHPGARLSALAFVEGEVAEQMLWDACQSDDQGLREVAVEILSDRDTSLQLELLTLLESEWSGIRNYNWREVLELKPDAIFADIMALDQMASDNQQLIQPKPAEHIAIALAISGYEPMRDALRTGRHFRNRSQLLLALFPDANSNGDLQSAVERLPEQVVSYAHQFLLLGHHRAVVDAMLNLARSGITPRGLNSANIFTAFSLVGNQLNPHEAIAALYRLDDDSVRRAYMRANLLAGHQEGHLDVLRGMGQRSTRQGLRVAVIIGAAGSPDLTEEWLEERRKEWSAPGATLIEEAFNLTQWFLDGQVERLEEVMNSGGELSKDATFLAARLGSRRAWRDLLVAAIREGRGLAGLAVLAPEIAEIPRGYRLELMASSSIYAWDWDGRNNVWRLNPEESGEPVNTPSGEGAE